MAVAPELAELVCIDVWALLEQPHSNDHGLPPKCFSLGHPCIAELDNSQLVRYKKIIA
jgi:hypothetical protein